MGQELFYHLQKVDCSILGFAWPLPHVRGAPRSQEILGFTSNNQGRQPYQPTTISVTAATMTISLTITITKTIEIIVTY